MDGRFLSVKESAGVQNRALKLVVSAPVELVRAALAGHAEVADTRELGRVVGANNLQFREVVHVLDQVHRTVTRYAIQRLRYLRRRLSGKPHGKATTLRLNIRKRQHKGLRKKTDAHGAVNKVAAIEPSRNLTALGSDDGGIGFDGDVDIDGAQLKADIDASSLAARQRNVLDNESLESSAGRGETILAGCQIGDLVYSVRCGDGLARNVRLHFGHRDLGVGDGCAGLVAGSATNRGKVSLRLCSGDQNNQPHYTQKRFSHERPIARRCCESQIRASPNPGKSVHCMKSSPNPTVAVRVNSLGRFSSRYCVD